MPAARALAVCALATARTLQLVPSLLACLVPRRPADGRRLTPSPPAAVSL